MKRWKWEEQLGQKERVWASREGVRSFSEIEERKEDEQLSEVEERKENEQLWRCVLSWCSLWLYFFYCKILFLSFMMPIFFMVKFENLRSVWFAYLLILVCHGEVLSLFLVRVSFVMFVFTLCMYRCQR